MSMKDFSKEILSCAVEIGTKILEYGASVTYVEEAIKRICAAYGVQRSDVFVITSTIIVTICKDDETFTQTSRILKAGTDFRKLEDFSVLVEKICSEGIEISILKEKIAEIENQKSHHPFMDFFGRLLVGASFAIFFGGDWKDSVCAAFCGGIVYFFEKSFQTVWNNKFVYLLFASAVCGFLAITAAKLGLCGNADKVMIGTIMLLIPGSSLYYALRSFIESSYDQFEQYAMTTGIVSAAISFGILLVTIFYNIIARTVIHVRDRKNRSTGLDT